MRKMGSHFGVVMAVAVFAVLYVLKSIVGFPEEVRDSVSVGTITTISFIYLYVYIMRAVIQLAYKIERAVFYRNG